jgi:hypothetical protein
VGYACRQNESHPGFIELWRREDFFVDDDPTDGGVFSLVYDRLLRFNVMYFPDPTEHGQGSAEQKHQGLEEWDSRIRKKIPYAVLLQIEYDATRTGDEPDPDAPGAPITRIVLLRGGAEDAVQPGSDTEGEEGAGGTGTGGTTGTRGGTGTGRR